MKNIESKFKNALENHEVDYDPQAFASFKKKLDSGSGVSTVGGSNKLTKIGIAASIIGVVSIGSYLLFSESNIKNDSKVDDNTEYVEHIENPISSDDKLTSSDEVHVVDDISIDDHAEKTSDDNFTSEIKSEVYNHEEVEGKNENSEFALDSRKEENKEDNLAEGKKEEKRNIPAIVLNSNFSSSKITGCEGLVCNFKPKQSNDYKGDYVWDFGDGSFSKERSPSHKYNKAGSYVVRLTLRSEINNSVISDHTEEYVTVYSKPNADFEVEEMSNTSIPEFTFINTTDNAVNWIWSFGDKTNNKSGKKDPSHTYRKKGTYTVRLIAKNGFGCTSSITKRVDVNNDYNLLAPTGFTPNGDGLNDYYLPRALEIMDAKFTMNIFHKNGKLYYETNQVSRPWDGRYMIDNQNAPAGAYVWIVKLKNKNGETEIYRGSVTLLRD